MSNVIATIEQDASAVIATLVQRVTAIEAGIAKAAPAVSTAIETASADATAIVTGAASVATAPNVVTIGTVFVPVVNAFVDVFNLIRGFVEGLEGLPVSGTSSSEQAGDSAGQAVRNVVSDALTGSEIAGPNAANKS
jgi:hypothetical protein